MGSAVSINGVPESGVVTEDGQIASGGGGGGGAGKQFTLSYGGSLTTAGFKARANGPSSEGTFSGFDGSEHTAANASAIDWVTITRTNVTSEVTFRLYVERVASGVDMVMPAGVRKLRFLRTDAVGAEQTVSVEYVGTLGSAPDFCIIDVRGTEN